MNRFSLALALLAAGCGDSAPDIPDMPPISVSSGGVSLMSEARTPREAYELAYGRLNSYHTKVRNWLYANPPNDYAIERTMIQIAESVETMHAVALEPKKSELVPLARWYREMSKGPWRGSFESELRRYERLLKGGFASSDVDVIAEFPDKKPPTAGGTDPKPPDDPKDKPKPPPTPPPSSDTPVWMLYNAWKQSHADLVEAYGKKGDCARAYQRVRESMAALKARLPEDRRKKLDLCDAIYQQQWDETKSYTAPPPGGKEEDVVRGLTYVGAEMEREYNPDKK